MKWMHCFHLIVPYAVLSNSAALFLEYVHYRLNWSEKGVYFDVRSQIEAASEKLGCLRASSNSIKLSVLIEFQT